MAKVIWHHRCGGEVTFSDGEVGSDFLQKDLINGFAITDRIFQTGQSAAPEYAAGEPCRPEGATEARCGGDPGRERSGPRSGIGPGALRPDDAKPVRLLARRRRGDG